MCVKYSTQVDFPCPLTIVSLVIFLPSLAGVSVEPDGDPGGLLDFEKSEFQHSHPSLLLVQLMNAESFLSSPWLLISQLGCAYVNYI